MVADIEFIPQEVCFYGSFRFSSNGEVVADPRNSFSLDRNTYSILPAESVNENETPVVRN